MGETQKGSDFGGAIIKSDYIVSLMLLAPLAFWGAVFVRNVGGHPVTGYVVAAAFATVAFPAIGIARLFKVKKLLTVGEEAVGRIQKVMLQGKRGRVEFTFPYLDETYTVSQAVRKSDVLDELKGGTKVRVRFDPKKPTQAVLPVIFERA